MLNNIVKKHQVKHLIFFERLVKNISLDKGDIISVVLVFERVGNLNMGGVNVHPYDFNMLQLGIQQGIASKAAPKIKDPHRLIASSLVNDVFHQRWTIRKCLFFGVSDAFFDFIHVVTGTV